MSPALAILLIATLYAFTIVLRGELHLADTFVLGALFVLFVWTQLQIGDGGGGTGRALGPYRGAAYGRGDAPW